MGTALSQPPGVPGLGAAGLGGEVGTELCSPAPAGDENRAQLHTARAARAASTHPHGPWPRAGRLERLTEGKSELEEICEVLS